MKKFHFNFFAVAAVAIALGTMSFKNYNAKAEITRWHLISVNGANQQADVVGMITSDPTEGGECGALEESIRCAVQLTYDDSYNPVGNTVAQVESASGNQALDRRFKPE
jgi:hypothetical protein